MYLWWFSSDPRLFLLSAWSCWTPPLLYSNIARMAVARWRVTHTHRGNCSVTACVSISCLWYEHWLKSALTGWPHSGEKLENLRLSQLRVCSPFHCLRFNYSLSGGQRSGFCAFCEDSDVLWGVGGLFSATDRKEEHHPRRLVAVRLRFSAGLQQGRITTPKHADSKQTNVNTEPSVTQTVSFSC